MKNTTVALILFFVLGAASASVLAHTPGSLTLEELYAKLEINEPSLLPGSPFYFFKNIGRGIRLLFIFDEVKKAERELRFADEKLGELAKLASKETKKQHALEKALENYLNANTRLQSRLESLRGKNKNVDNLLAALARRSLEHEEIFEKVIEDEIGEAGAKKAAASIAKNVEKVLALDEKKFSEKLKKVQDEIRDPKNSERPNPPEELLKEPNKKSEDAEKENRNNPQDKPGESRKEKPIINLNAAPALPAVAEQTAPPPPAEPPPPSPPSPSPLPSPPVASSPSQVMVQARIENFAFHPNEIRIAVGDTIVWTNKDAAMHNVRSDTDLFIGELLAKGERYQKTFTEKGTFPYHCHPHPFMKGTVIVE